MALTAWLVLLSGVGVAQTRGDLCQVYVVDRAKALKAENSYRDTGNPEKDTKAFRAAQTLFPEFETKVGEEELTTKTYLFPGSKLVITASIFYTDESMASQGGGSDSMVVAVAVAERPLKDAFAASVERSAVAEVSYNKQTDTVRAKQYVRVRGRLYLVGVECHVRRGAL